MPKPFIKARPLCLILIAVLAVIAIGCTGQPQSTATPAASPKPATTRAGSISASAVKITPETDSLPPQLHSDEFQKPVPLSNIINTAGVEDSAFITPDGNTLYFFFTPDPNVQAEKQLLDGVTGIYVSHKTGSIWSEPERVHLQDPADTSLDGCAFVQGDTMWFCSARAGNFRPVDMWTAKFVGGKWTDWENAGRKLNVDYDIGELHITADGNEMYFHSQRAGGKGGYDIWVTKKINGEWQPPENVAAVNTKDDEGWPFVTQDGNELWFTRIYMGSPAIFRSKKTGGDWGTPELIISQFAAEPSLDSEGNIYFTHLYAKNGAMIEADVYVAYKK